MDLLHSTPWCNALYFATVLFIVECNNLMGGNERIFYDNCSSFASWTTPNSSEVTLSNLDCAHGSCFLVGGGDSLTSQSISTQNYTNLQFSFFIKPSLHSNSLCQIYYAINNEQHWSLLQSYRSDINGIWLNDTRSLPPLFYDQIRVKLYVTKQTNHTDSCSMDDFSVFGSPDALNIASTPYGVAIFIHFEFRLILINSSMIDVENAIQKITDSFIMADLRDTHMYCIVSSDYTLSLSHNVTSSSNLATINATVSMCNNRTRTQFITDFGIRLETYFMDKMNQKQSIVSVDNDSIVIVLKPIDEPNKNTVDHEQYIALGAVVLASLLIMFCLGVVKWLSEMLESFCIIRQ